MLGRRGLPLFQFSTSNTAPALLLHIRQDGSFFLLAQQIAQHFMLDTFPAFVQNHLAFCRKFLPGTNSGQRCFCIAVRFSYGAEQTRYNQPQDVQLPGGQSRKVSLHHTFRRQQRVVVADFAVVDHLSCMGRHSFIHIKSFHSSRYQPRQRCRHIFRQKTAVCSGIGDELLFIKALSIVQGLLCSKAQQAVSISLEHGEVV